MKTDRGVKTSIYLPADLHAKIMRDIATRTLRDNALTSLSAWLQEAAKQKLEEGDR